VPCILAATADRIYCYLSQGPTQFMQYTVNSKKYQCKYLGMLWRCSCFTPPQTPHSHDHCRSAGARYRYRCDSTMSSTCSAQQVRGADGCTNTYKHLLHRLPTLQCNPSCTVSQLAQWESTCRECGSCTSCHSAAGLVSIAPLHMPCKAPPRRCPHCLDAPLAGSGRPQALSQCTAVMEGTA
jgi:hypothetical protein